MTSRTSFLFAAIGAALLMPQLASAQDKGAYVSMSGMVGVAGDSDNDGVFTDAFQTGPGTNIADNSIIAAGSGIDWTTDFDIGFGGNIAIGKKFGPKYDEGGFRIEAELAFDSFGVDTHTDVNAAGLALDMEDAAVLISSANSPIGASVATVVADGQGDVSSRSVFANAYYDIPLGERVTPYVGGGLGWTWTDVEYSPSDLPIIDEIEEAVSWQLMAGATYQLSYETELFGGIRYRGSQDADVQARLFPVDFDIQYQRLFGEFGIRFNFS